MNTRSFAKYFGTLTLLGFLAACGGGGSAPPVAPPAAAITAQPTDQSVVAGTAAIFSVVASNATGYQWQRSTDGGASFTSVSAATNASHTTAASTLLDSGTQYRAVVSGTSNSVTSSAATLTVTAAVVAPSISVQPAGQTITAGQNASFSVTAGGTSISYQWQRSTDDGASFTDLAGASNATLTLTAVALADNARQFRVVVSNSAGSVTSNAALLTVNPALAAPAFTTQPASATVVAPNTATFSAVATGNPSPTLQWQLSTNAGGSFADIASATGGSYTTLATTGDSGKQYRVIATNGSGATTSGIATLTVTAPSAPAFTTQPASITITAGQNAPFTVAASGAPTPTLQWQLSTDNGGTWGNITGETGTTYTALNVALANNGRQFRAVVSNSAGVVNSGAAVLTVTAASPVTITTTSPLPDATVNTPYSVSLAATGGVTPYVWSLASGSMPPGFSLNPSTGVFSGSGSTGSVNYNLNIQVTDSAIPAQSSQGYFSLNVQPICDVGLGSATVANPPAASFGGKFCPQTKTPPGAPNPNGDVTAFWFESYSYPSGNYLQSVSVTFNPLTGAVYSVVYNLNDPTHLVSLLCSRETFSPPPCAGVTVNVGTGLVTLINTVVDTGSPATLNGLLHY